jgi:hypothetical protein
MRPAFADALLKLKTKDVSEDLKDERRPVLAVLCPEPVTSRPMADSLREMGLC